MDSSVLARLSIEQMHIGFSKKCCPTCAAILKCVFTELRQPLRIQGAHSNVCPCAFPPGLPVQITTHIVNKYRKLLKTELLEIAKPKGRTSSVMSLAVEQPHLKSDAMRFMDGLDELERKDEGLADDMKLA